MTHHRPAPGIRDRRAELIPGPAGAERPDRPRRVLVIGGGIAESLDWSPARVRLLFILSLLIPGPQAIFYLVAWLIIPKAD